MAKKTEKRSTLTRQWEMLRLIPRQPRKISPDEIRERLAGLGYKVNVRTVQRDLHELSRLFPFVYDDLRNKPIGWSWMEKAPQFDIPGLDPQTALTLKLVETFLKPLLPVTTLNYLAPYTRRADEIMKALSPRSLGTWPGKVRVITRGPALIPPIIKPQVHDTVYRALLEDKRVLLKYRPRGGSASKDYEVSVLGLVIREPIFYLVCALWDYENPIQLALHRIVEAELLEKPVAKLKGFDLDDYIHKGEFSYVVGPKIRLEARFLKETAEHLYESKLSLDQTISELDGKWILLKATVNNTAELRWWLLGFGNAVEVMKPINLHREMSKVLSQAAARY